MTQADVISLIQQWIIQNGNQEITADVLRPLLVEICNATQLMTGDPDDLTTSNKSNLVAAINELKAITSNLTGVVIRNGTTDPNLGGFIWTPSAGNFYRWMNGSSLRSFWIYNGYEWIEIKPLRGYTVDNLPPGNIGDTAYVTDADSPTYLGVAVGGGSTVCKVFYNGSNWIT